MSSVTGISYVDAQFHAGQDLGIGVAGPVSAGESSFSVLPWLDDDYQGTYKDWSFSTGPDEVEPYQFRDEPYHFRMMNDLGGQFLHDDDDLAFHFGRSSNGTGGDPYLLPEYEEVTRRNSTRSTHIAYSTVGEMKAVISKGLSAAARLGLQEPDFSSYAYLDQLPDDGIGEFGITNNAGVRYNYGLPVVSLDEIEMSYGLKGVDYEVTEGMVKARVKDPGQMPVVVGRESKVPYASEYLITSILSTDYVDVTSDGITNDDLGGWVKFTYVPITNHEHYNTGYYKWRIPYQGLDRQQNRIANLDDDVGTVASGMKSKFQLAAIETKSHIAVFYTNGESRYPWRSVVSSHGSAFARGWNWLVGSNHIRKDAYQAHADERIAANDNFNAIDNPSSPVFEDPTVAPGTTNQADNLSKRLEKIELWSKNEEGGRSKKQQTVHFEYDATYPLCSGLPNSFGRAGKLTLSRVYFEHGNNVNARISPYVFGYEYKTLANSDFDGLPSDLTTKYSSVLNHGSSLSSAEQNPDYSTSISDRWGYYEQKDLNTVENENRDKNSVPWVNQNPEEDEFDPAAWHLKSIRLPSGGEIHVHYEQNEYAYVQDQPAMVMANISSYTGHNTTTKKFYLDLDRTFGIGTTQSTAGDDIVDVMDDLFVTGKEKVFFKLFHSIDGESATSASLDKISNKEAERHEYIDGYARVKGVGWDGVGYYIELADADDEDQPGTISSPKEAVINYAEGMKGRSGGAEPFQADADAEGNVKALFGFMDWAAKAVGFSEEIGDETDEIDYKRSWVRIPIASKDRIARSKLGGGVRVKNLLIYDPGIWTSASLPSEVPEGHLWGTTYSYIDELGNTSGVAANEPAAGREENALVRLLDKRRDKGFFDGIITGKDRQAFEGPIGESLLPSPGVVYSRVVVKNLHTGKTNAGFSIHEYFTARDYPSIVHYSTDQTNPDYLIPANIESDFPVFFWTPWGTWTETSRIGFQGYSFILNSMHGKPRAAATYGGDYADPSTWVASSEQSYEYFEPGEPIPVLETSHAEPVLSYASPGKEIEVVSEGKEMLDKIFDASAQLDASFGMIFFPPIFATAAVQANITKHRVKTHVTSKVVRYPTLLKKMTSTQDGIENVEETIAFSRLTGQPVVQKSMDGYHGLVLEQAKSDVAQPTGTHDRSFYSYVWPAAMDYPGMAQKSLNEGMVFQNGPELKILKHYWNKQHYLSVSSLITDVTGSLSDYFAPGDLLRLSTIVNLIGQDPFEQQLGRYYVDRVVGSRVYLQPHSMTTPILWFSSEWLETTDPTVTVDGLKVEIVKSGRTNQLTTPSGSMQRYQTDIVPE